MSDSGLADPAKPQTMPYKAEYAKSGRSTCKKCNKLIREDELRIAAQVKSRLFDGMQTNWHHLDCFFIRNRPTSLGDIDNLEGLRSEDQKLIEKKFEQIHSREMSPGKHMILSDFKVEYPRSAKSTCPVCEHHIEENHPRIGMIDFESENSRRFGPHFKWHHVDCFAKARDRFGFTASGEELKGFSDLEPDDQEQIRIKLPPQHETKPSKGRGKAKKAGSQFKTEPKSEEKEQAPPPQAQTQGRGRKRSPAKSTSKPAKGRASPKKKIIDEAEEAAEQGGQATGVSGRKRQSKGGTAAKSTTRKGTSPTPRSRKKSPPKSPSKRPGTSRKKIRQEQEEEQRALDEDEQLREEMIELEKAEETGRKGTKKGQRGKQKQKGDVGVEKPTKAAKEPSPPKPKATGKRKHEIQQPDIGGKVGRGRNIPAAETSEAA